MAKLDAKPTLKLEIALVLSESEARALDAIAGYGVDEFLKVFYTHIGRSYLEPHAVGVHSLFDSVRDQLPAILARMTAARKAFSRDDNREMSKQ